MTEDEAKAKLIPLVKKGTLVSVTRGRKVPHGTVGVVRWEGDGEWGPRVGLSVVGEEKLVYTAFKNVDAVYPGLLPGQRPEGGWLELWGKVQREQLLPAQGHRVLHRESGLEGDVFWVGNEAGDRLGFKTAPTEHGPAVTIWADAPEVWLLSGGIKQDYKTKIPAQPCLVQMAHVKVVGLKSLPFPFNEITVLEPVPSGGYRGLNARGEFVTTLSESVAHNHFLPEGSGT
jgi:hypothetical protein